MTRFSVRHSTTYAFSAPVALGRHTLYVRPRADHALSLSNATLTLSPPADVIWRGDVYGNSVAHVDFEGQTSLLKIDSAFECETFPRSEQQRRALLEGADMVYSNLERRILAPFMEIAPTARDAISGWMEVTEERKAKTVYDSLLECAARIRFELDYRVRFEPGVQTPSETLASHSGTCRDFAELMIAAARYLGCAARFVTGYVFTPNAAPGSSSPHAWAECYVPGAGWIEIDATNGLVEHGDLIPVAIAVAGADLTPISGTFAGSATSTLSVGVDVNKLL